jgi:hypothetical protein
VAGGVLPDMGAGANYWVSGGGLLATEATSLRVRLLPGTARIDGVNYDFVLDPVMGDPMEMGDGVVIGSGIGIEEIDPPPAVGYYRYDAFVIGVDGVVDYLKGTEKTGTTGPPFYGFDPPIKPAIPGGHVIFGDYILVYGGMTEITQSDIGRIFSQAHPYRLEMVFEFDEMIWHDPDHPPPPPYDPVPHPTTSIVYLQMIDQYGNYAPRPGGGNYQFHLGFIGYMDGMGVIGERSYAGQTLNPTTGEVVKEGSYATMLNYERTNAKEGVSYNPGDGYTDDLSPALVGYVDYNGIRYNASGRIVCLDENGTPMPPYLVL